MIVISTTRTRKYDGKEAALIPITLEPRAWPSRLAGAGADPRGTKSRHGLFVLTLILATSPLAVPRALGQANPNGNAVRASVVRPERRTINRDLRLPGTLAADEQVDLFAKISGYVSKIELDIGDRVQKGRELLTISVPEMKDELRQAQAVLAAKQARVRALRAKATQAQRMIETAHAQVQRQAAEHELDAANLTRRRALHEANAIPEEALDEARSASAVSEAQLQIARAQVAGAEAQKQAVDADVQVAQSDVMVATANIARIGTLMQYASIRAPFAGVITVRNVDHGTFVRSAADGTTAPLLRIAKTDRIRIVVDVPESDARFVRVGTEAIIDVKALGTGPFNATVSRTAAALEPKTRTMRAEIDIDNGDNQLIPGMYAHVTLHVQAIVDAMVIPSKAIRVQGKQVVVFVAANGITRSIPIKLGYDDGIWAEVKSGLSGDEQVITATSSVVAPGVAVATVTPG